MSAQTLKLTQNAFFWLYAQKRAMHTFVQKEKQEQIEMFHENRVEALTYWETQAEHFFGDSFDKMFMDIGMSNVHAFTDPMCVETVLKGREYVRAIGSANIFLKKHFSPYYSMEYVADYISNQFPNLAAPHASFNHAMPYTIANRLLNKVVDL